MRKETAKFLCGLTAWESIVHAILDLSDNLPMTFFGITLTSTSNTIQIIVPAMLSFALGWYAWSKNEVEKSVR